MARGPGQPFQVGNRYSFKSIRPPNEYTDETDRMHALGVNDAAVFFPRDGEGIVDLRIRMYMRQRWFRDRMTFRTQTYRDRLLVWRVE